MLVSKQGKVCLGKFVLTTSIKVTKNKYQKLYWWNVLVLLYMQIHICNQVLNLRCKINTSKGRHKLYKYVSASIVYIWELSCTKKVDYIPLKAKFLWYFILLLNKASKGQLEHILWDLTKNQWYIHETFHHLIWYICYNPNYFFFANKNAHFD